MEVWYIKKDFKFFFKPNQDGIFGCSVAGGGLNQPPPEISAVEHHENWHIRYLWRNLPNYKKKEIKMFFFILY